MYGASNLLARYTHNPATLDDVLSVSVSPSGVVAGVAQSAGNYYYLKDHLGSITSITNTTGAIIQKYNYKSFGRMLSVTDAAGVDISAAPVVRTSFTYTGREYDEDTGFYYYRARYLDASTGRFLQQDPEPGKVQNPISVINHYIYAGNAPTIFTDRSGRIFGIDDLIFFAVVSLVNTAYQNNKKGGNFLEQFAFNFVSSVVLSVVIGDALGATGWGDSFSTIGKAAFNGLKTGLIQVGLDNYITTNGFSQDQQSALGFVSKIFGAFLLNEVNSSGVFPGSYDVRNDLLDPKNISSFSNWKKFMAQALFSNPAPQYQSTSN